MIQMHANANSCWQLECMPIPWFTKLKQKWTVDTVEEDDECTPGLLLQPCVKIYTHDELTSLTLQAGCRLAGPAGRGKTIQGGRPCAQLPHNILQQYHQDELHERCERLHKRCQVLHPFLSTTGFPHAPIPFMFKVVLPSLIRVILPSPFHRRVHRL